MQITRSRLALYASIIASLGFGGSALGAESNPWLVRAGASLVQPDSDNGSLDVGSINVDGAYSFTFNVSYFFTPEVAVELLAAYPFSHDFTVHVGSANVDGKVDHLPPTLSVQYHFLPNERWRPYVGAGVNYTMFSNAKLDNVPASVSLDDSIGLALQTGIDIALTDNWLVNFDVRYIHINSDVKVGGSNVGTVDINPMVYGLNVGYRF